ncbi:haloacid dehalogenase superfamily, subfamily IA, variant 3 with third motif having DD or ED/haloacid dehalogenase superfamily, subfamily IA, variant 1 with third motif having Dx(3-4)D or Dx(3-4)E [Pseudomonas sp. ok272]|uniref:HAD family hydrolase n=1 Tax=unclassified Pseudomonas TaxID=196821 RepID=UPI0008CE873C|nr:MULTISPECIES: HAD family hydrolase [unclassified Pseudomonas]SEM93777.1 haloacid dehalogenase superfamily, subfamily IA, variant 3 with third motif having DD or ED/haloacid dehalogenase superfamily, subfamily IA, variant 1 with third motif having Dx(3-4)D or Dx(3-4)E [Pseudomonas sp. ok272]SFM94536.1 haloacid dehalogenase superfamily, subfamily IA, variant 3 with third motif having DD or ED/haloacid dehalogenase superfamily, subfamily IA, variant 1 with third motif having Dx(3-4)D or Dx(3-4)E 
MSLSHIDHWVFDMDGTLTVAVHDFAAIREALGIPPEDDILTHLATLPAEEGAAKHAWLLEHERDLALGSKPARGAVELVRELAERGYRLGILTRNTRELAYITLQAIGLADCFAIEDVLGRDDATPKPDPDGLLKLAQAWKVEPRDMVMVGDYRYDLDCGRAAGARTVLVNLPDNPWPELVDWHAADCVALRQMLLA